MITNKVEICGVNTSTLPILKNDEKKALFDRILQGDGEAREEYIYGNLRLVLSVIKRFNNRGEYVDDIFQVGCIGLIKAIDNFDVSHGVKFSTYAVPMNVIRRENSILFYYIKFIINVNICVSYGNFIYTIINKNFLFFL